MSTNQPSFPSAGADSWGSVVQTATRESGTITAVSPRPMMTAPTPADPGDTQRRLRIAVERQGSAVIVCAAGEADASNCDTWRHALTTATATVMTPGALVVDVRGLDFMAICAYAGLADVAQRCQRRGARLWLVSDQPIVAKALAICRLSDLLPTASTVEAALARDSDAHGQ